MDLLTFIRDGERKAKLAEATGASAGYLWQIATGWRGKRASPELAQSIERETAVIGPKPVLKGALRPDLWPDCDTEDTPDPHRPGAAAEGSSAAQSPDDLSEAA